MMQITKKKTLITSGVIIILIGIIAMCMLFQNNKKPATPKVTFYTEDGRIFYQQDVTPDSPPIPYNKQIPEIARKVFSGWDKDIMSLKKNNVTDIYAKYLDVSNEENVFTLPAAYGVETDTIKVPLKLMGKVNICATDIVISYDTQILEYVECENTDPDVTVKNEAEPGLIYVRFVSSENITGEIDLTTLSFKIKTTEKSETDIQIHVKDAVKINNKNEIIDADYGVVDSKIHIIPDGYFERIV